MKITFFNAFLKLPFICVQWTVFQEYKTSATKIKARKSIEQLSNVWLYSYKNENVVFPLVHNLLSCVTIVK